MSVRRGREVEVSVLQRLCSLGGFFCLLFQKEFSSRFTDSHLNSLLPGNKCPLVGAELKVRALCYTKEWEGESRKRAEKESFWIDFFTAIPISAFQDFLFRKQVLAPRDLKS